MAGGVGVVWIHEELGPDILTSEPLQSEPLQSEPLQSEPVGKVAADQTVGPDDPNCSDRPGHRDAPVTRPLRGSVGVPRVSPINTARLR